MRKKKSAADLKSPEKLALDVLSLPLRKRINKFIAIDDLLCAASSNSPEPFIEPKVNSCRCGFRCVLISQPIFQRTEVTVNIEPRCEPRPLSNAKKNWLDEYRSQTRKDRIKWDTKLYSRSKRFQHQTLYEQIDELADIAATEFADWINTLASDEKNRLNCETIKQLFSISIEDDVSKSISIGLKQRPAISRELADMFDCPEVHNTTIFPYFHVHLTYVKNEFSAID